MISRKTRRCIIHILVMLLLLVACSSDNPAANASTPYVYPILPGTDEWAELQSLDDMIAACNVPQDILDDMDTKTLVETVLDYPLLINMFAFNTTVSGIESVFSYSSPCQELQGREDASTVLLEAYKECQLPIEEDFDTEDELREAYWRFAHLETFLGWNEFYAKLSSEQAIELEALAQKNRDTTTERTGSSASHFFAIRAEETGGNRFDY